MKKKKKEKKKGQEGESYDAEAADDYEDDPSYSSRGKQSSSSNALFRTADFIRLYLSASVTVQIILLSCGL